MQKIAEKLRGSKNSKGSITIVLLIAVVIIGSVYFVNGIFPTVEHIDIGEEDRQVQIDMEATDATGAAENALRLKTIKFEDCSQTAAVTLQLDITGSMARAIGDLKEGVYAFTDQLSDNSVIGIQAYSTRNARLEVIPVSLFKDVKDQIRPIVGNLRAGGGTPSYAALQFSREILQQAISDYPGRQFSYIFFSDGNPNRGPSSPEDISRAAQEIKDLGVTVYAIGYGNINRNIIERVASAPDKAFYTSNSDDLKNIYGGITTKLCEGL